MMSDEPSSQHYLDFAATSAVRPPEVTQAVHEALTGLGASPGRGGHNPSVDAGRTVFRARRAVAGLLGLPGDPGRVAFLMNATQALNCALYGLTKPGDAVVFTQYDHNAVLRPVSRLARERDVEARMIQGAPDGSVDLEEAEERLDGARLLVVNAVSNVLGTRLPLESLANRAHDAGALVLVDAAQSAGHLPQRPAEEGADLVAFTGHKGLLGPQGVGGLWVREDLDMEPLLCGGTGGDSRRREMPARFPERLEAGTPNVPGIAGLLAGCRYLRESGVEAIHRRTSALKERLRDGLDAVPGVRVLSPPDPDGGAVVTVTVEGMDPAAVAKELAERWGVLTRAGLHCAPEAHRLLGTEEEGAVRFSLGWASTEEDVHRAVEGMDAVAASPRSAAGGSHRAEVG